MQPPVAIAVDDLGHDKGGHGRNLDASWTLQGSHGPILGHADPVPEQGRYSILSASHGQGAAVTNTPADMRMNSKYDPIPADAPEQSGLCGAVSRLAQPCAAVVGRPGRASGLAPGGPLPVPGRVAGIYDPRADGGGGTVRRAVRARAACRSCTQPEENDHVFHR